VFVPKVDLKPHLIEKCPSGLRRPNRRRRPPSDRRRVPSIRRVRGALQASRHRCQS
jgi:hypothetical protein